MKTTWEEISAKLRETLDSGIHRVWIAPLRASIEGPRLVLAAPNAFMVDWIASRLLAKITDAFASVSGIKSSDIKIELKIADAPAQKPDSIKDVISRAIPRPATAQTSLPISISVPSASMSWRYKFDDFVTGASNNLAVAAARDLSQSGQVRSLFVTSAPGLGKTHLAQAAGQLLGECHKAAKVAYLTAEQFASRYVAAMRSKDLEGFKHYLCSLDALLFEDVHFLQRKKAMQEFALTVIKNLDAKGARVIFTSSFAPHQLQDMDAQLASYFRSGILASMDRPDCSMRKEILRRKAKSFQVSLPDAVCDILSEKISSDVRQLESCLKNMIFKARVLNSGLTIDLALDTLNQYTDTGRSLDLTGILRLVCESFGLTETQLRSRSRKHEYVQGRNTVFFLARKHTDLSLETIGNALNRKHSTVMRSITQVEKELARESREGRQIARAVALIERKCGIDIDTREQ